MLPVGTAIGGGVRPRGLAANGTAVGDLYGAAVWTPDGSGGYVLTQLDGQAVNGISNDASLAVGIVPALYWLSSGGSWSPAQTFPGGCSGARAVAGTSRRVAMNDCPFGNKSTPAYIDPPFVAPVQLGGAGPNNIGGDAKGISPNGQYVGGSGSYRGSLVGFYWKLF